MREWQTASRYSKPTHQLFDVRLNWQTGSSYTDNLWLDAQSLTVRIRVPRVRHFYDQGSTRHDRLYDLTLADISAVLRAVVHNLPLSDQREVAKQLAAAEPDLFALLACVRGYPVR